MKRLLGRSWLWAPLICLLVLLGAWAGWQAYLTRFRLGFVPAELGVTQVTYAKERASGLGPGANEAGVFVFRLPAGVARRVSREELGFLSGLNSTSWRDRYETWRQTPVREGVGPNGPEGLKSSKIRDYLGRYGFGLDLTVAPTVIDMIDRTLQRPGSYWASGRTGVLIVAPDAELVVYVYAG